MNTIDENTTTLSPKAETDDRSTNGHRQIIGYLGLILPVLLWLMAGLRPTIGLPPWELLSSISTYYYTAAVTAFAGSLVALGLFLFSYRGYDNKYGYRDRIAAIIAGLAALLIVLFPTNAPENLPSPSWWTPLMGRIHYISAAILFASFVFFCLFQFTKSKPGKPTRGKQLRNRIYIACGVGIIAGLVWVVVALFMQAAIFWPETLALEFFGVSWVVKGRADITLIEVSKQAILFGRQSRKLL